MLQYTYPERLNNKEGQMGTHRPSWEGQQNRFYGKPGGLSGHENKSDWVTGPWSTGHGGREYWERRVEVADILK